MMGVTKYEDTAVLVQCKVYKCWIQWSGRPRVGRRKQRVETVTSAFGRKWGAAAQPEIGVGKLDRLEEEKKTPEAASNDEVDMSEEEEFDEDDEGILEHAINAGLLNDDDREMFRESIARIERTPSSRFVVEWILRCPRREQNNCPTKEKDTGIRRYWLAYCVLRVAPFVLNMINMH